MTRSVDRRAQELEERGERFAFATVVRVDRPLSARPGDNALIRSDGRLEGWVGGSCSQPIVIRERWRRWRMDAAGSSGSVPPGLPPSPAGPEWSPRSPRARRRGPRCVRGTATTAAGDSDCGILPCGAHASAARRSLGATRSRGPRRPSEQTPAAEVRLDVDALRGASLGPADSVVVATMNRYDEAALESALVTTAGYVGLVASRQRAAKVLDMLRARGVAEGDLERVHSPAGLDLGPSSQEEIALAVLAEIVASRVEADSGERPLCAPGEAIDPVCGMVVSASDLSPSAIYEDRMVFFCSPHCKSAFESEPTRYESTVPDSA